MICLDVSITIWKPKHGGKVVTLQMIGPEFKTVQNKYPSKISVFLFPPCKLKALLHKYTKNSEISKGIIDDN